MEYVSRFDCVCIILYMAIRGKLFCRAGHYFLVFVIFLKNLEEEPALQCRRQFERRTRRHGSLVQGLLRESWIRGCSASRTILSAGLQDYEDKRLMTLSRVRKVRSLAWK